MLFRPRCFLVVYPKVKYGVRSSKFIWAPYALYGAHWLTPRNPPPPLPAFGLIYGRYWSAKIDDISL